MVWSRRLLFTEKFYVQIYEIFYKAACFNCLQNVDAILVFKMTIVSKFTLYREKNSLFFWTFLIELSKYMRFKLKTIDDAIEFKMN